MPAPAMSPALEDRGAITAIRPPPIALFIALGVGIALVAVAIVVIVARGIGAARGATGEAMTSVSTAAPPPSPAVPSSAPAPPVVNLDSLPVSSSPASNPVKGMGFIGIAASPGSCAVAIDGTARGWTPLGALKLTVGPHEVQCFPASGKAHSMTVTVEEGMVSRFRFDLGEGQ